MKTLNLFHTIFQMKNVPGMFLQRQIFLCISWQRFGFFFFFLSLFFFFFSWFKTVFWNATCQEKINAVVSNISCFSVSRQVHIGSFILYSLEKGHRLYSLGLELHSVGQVLWLFFNLWNTWGGWFQEDEMLLCYSHVTHSDTSVCAFFCRVIKNQFATQ